MIRLKTAAIPGGLIVDSLSEARSISGHTTYLEAKNRVNKNAFQLPRLHSEPGPIRRNRRLRTVEQVWLQTSPRQTKPYHFAFERGSPSVPSGRARRKGHFVTDTLCKADRGNSRQDRDWKEFPACYGRRSRTKPCTLREGDRASPLQGEPFPHSPVLTDRWLARALEMESQRGRPHTVGMVLEAE